MGGVRLESRAEQSDHPVSVWLQDMPRKIMSYVYNKLSALNVISSLGMKTWEEDLSAQGKQKKLIGEKFGIIIFIHMGNLVTEHAG